MNDWKTDKKSLWEQYQNYLEYNPIWTMDFEQFQKMKDQIKKKKYKKT